MRNIVNAEIDIVIRGGWIIDHDGKPTGLCGDCVARYQRVGGGPVRIGVTIPKVLAAIGSYMAGRVKRTFKRKGKQ